MVCIAKLREQNMILPLIGIGIVYLAIGVFILIVFVKNRLSGFTLWNVLATIFLWLPVGAFLWVQNKIENM